MVDLLRRPRRPFSKRSCYSSTPIGVCGRMTQIAPAPCAAATAKTRSCGADDPQPAGCERRDGDATISVLVIARESLQAPGVSGRLGRLACLLTVRKTFVRPNVASTGLFVNSFPSLARRFYGVVLRRLTYLVLGCGAIWRNGRGGPGPRGRDVLVSDADPAVMRREHPRPADHGTGRGLHRPRSGEYTSLTFRTVD